MNVSNNQTSINKTALSDNELKVILNVAYGIMAAVAIVSNGCLCAMFVADKDKFKNSPHMFVFSLAVTDVLSGITVMLTPSLMISEDQYLYPSQPGLDIFCRLVASQYFLFSFGLLSVLTAMVIAIDRWFAASKPLKYNKIFSPQVSRGITITLWLMLPYFSLENIFRRIANPKTNESCTWVDLIEGQWNGILFLILQIIRLFIPSIIIIFCYADIIRTMNSRIGIEGRRSEMQKKNHRRLTRMLSIAAIVLLICWLPNEIYYTLVQLNAIHYNEQVALALKILIVANSCINPFIYSATNKIYRKRFVAFFSKLSSKVNI